MMEYFKIVPVNCDWIGIEFEVASSINLVGILKNSQTNKSNFPK